MTFVKKTLISIVGPTAVGKTAFAISLARHFKTEIISADSRQFYQEMEIGTAKPDKEELAQVKHHFINSHSIENYYSCGRFEEDALVLLESLFQRLNPVVAVGGSGLYFKALWHGMDDMPKVGPAIREDLNRDFESKGLEFLLKELKLADPDYYEKVDRQNHQRVIRALEVIRSTAKPFSAFRTGSHKKRFFENIKIGLETDRDQLYERIDQRMDMMIANGLFEEAKALYKDRDRNALQTVGYKEIFEFIDGKYDRDEAIRLLKRNSRRYAKRQMTWFRKDPEVNWIHPNDLEQVIQMITLKLNT